MAIIARSISALAYVLAAGSMLAAQEVSPAPSLEPAPAPSPTPAAALTPAPTAPAPQVQEHEDGVATSSSLGAANISSMSQVRIVRLSQVMGKVDMDRNTKTGFEPTFANLPIIQGVRLKTGEGLAEVEFEDNSSLRIAPDTQLEVTRLGRNSAGNTSNGFLLSQGTLYLSLADTKGNDFVVRSGEETFTLAPASHIRLDVYPAGSELKVFKGSVEVTGSTGNYALAKGKVFSFGGQQAAAPKIAKNDEPGLYDGWDKQSVDYHSVRNIQSYAGNGYQYGANDLNYYGSFSNLSGCGNVWQPYFASANWNPYSSGMWAYYPGAGYSFVSPYPWGWQPYHSGSWVSCGGAGWGWQPGNNWNGLNNIAGNSFTSGSLTLRKPVVSHSPGITQPTLVAVGVNNLHRSQLNPSQKFEFAKDSAGFGVPRSAFGNLNKMSQQLAVRGTAQTHMDATPISIPTRGSASVEAAGRGNASLASTGRGAAMSNAHMSAPMSRPVAVSQSNNGGNSSMSAASGGMRGGSVGGNSAPSSSHMSSAPSAPSHK